MELRDLVRPLLDGDLLRAREWVADAQRAHVDWSRVDPPTGLDPLEMTVAAGLVELFAARVTGPSWTAAVGASREPVVLDPGLEQMPRSFRVAKSHGPDALRRRNLFALPDFLDVA